MSIDLSQPCAQWSGTIDVNGYGRLWDGKSLRSAHRISYESVHGPIAADLLIDHACHNADMECHGGNSCLHRSCVNPAHLEPVTRAENNRRGRVNATKTHCKRGHPFNEVNTYVAARGSRECRTCNAARAKARYAQKASQTATV